MDMLEILRSSISEARRISYEVNNQKGKFPYHEFDNHVTGQVIPAGMQLIHRFGDSLSYEEKAASLAVLAFHDTGFNGNDKYSVARNEFIGASNMVRWMRENEVWHFSERLIERSAEAVLFTNPCLMNFSPEDPLKQIAMDSDFGYLGLPWKNFEKAEKLG